MKLTAAQGKDLRVIAGLPCHFCGMSIRDKGSAVKEIDEKNDETIVAHARCYYKEINKKHSYGN